MSAENYVPTGRAVAIMRSERHKLKVWRVVWLDVEDNVRFNSDVVAYAAGFAVLKVEAEWEDEKSGWPSRAAVVESVHFLSYAS